MKHLTDEQLLEIASKPVTKKEKRDANLTPIHMFARHHNFQSGDRYIPSTIIYKFYLDNTKSKPVGKGKFFFYFNKLFKQKRQWNTSGYLMKLEPFNEKAIIMIEVKYYIKTDRSVKFVRRHNAFLKIKEKTRRLKISRTRETPEHEN